MKKRILATVLTSVIIAGAIAGCGSTGSTDTATAATSASANEAATSADAEASDAATSDSVVLKVAASPTPHAEILAQAKPILAKEGIDLEVTEFEDYVQPNEVVESGDFDANYFQHVPYLDSMRKRAHTLSQPERSTMNLLEFTREQRQALMISLTVMS